MTRCIRTRCIRFATEVAGVPELEQSEEVKIWKLPLIRKSNGVRVICKRQICPVRTSKPYVFEARPWELKTETIDVMMLLDLIQESILRMGS